MYMLRFNFIFGLIFFSNQFIFSNQFHCFIPAPSLKQFSLSLTVPDDLTELEAPATPSKVG